MTLVEHLSAARSLVSSGWSEPFCRGAGGVILGERDEGVYTWAVLDALRITSLDTAADAWEALERVALPLRGALDDAARRGDVSAAVTLSGLRLSGMDLQVWLETPGRKLVDVLRIFDAAIARASSKS